MAKTRNVSIDESVGDELGFLAKLLKTKLDSVTSISDVIQFSVDIASNEEILKLVEKQVNPFLTEIKKFSEELEIIRDQALAEKDGEKVKALSKQITTLENKIKAEKQKYKNIPYAEMMLLTRARKKIAELLN